jgi:hypothetical protein
MASHWNIKSNEHQLPDSLRRMMMGRAYIARIEKRHAYRIFVGKSRETNHLLLRRRYVDNIIMDLRDMGWGVMD